MNLRRHIAVLVVLLLACGYIVFSRQQVTADDTPQFGLPRRAGESWTLLDGVDEISQCHRSLQIILHPCMNGCGFVFVKGVIGLRYTGLGNERL